MRIFLILLGKIIPLYLFILLGFIAGKWLKIEKVTVANILIYIIAPVIVFHGVVTTPIGAGLIILPIFYFALSSAIALLFYKIGRYFFHDNTRNILAFAAGAGNTGYFGLPVVVALFGEKALGIMVLIVMGVILFENSTGFFLVARGSHTIRESIGKLLRLPAIYAFIIAILINISGIRLDGPRYLEIIGYFRSAFTLLGMMLIGIGLAEVNRYSMDLKFLGGVFLGRFIVWPLIIFTVVFLDRNYFRFLNGEIYQVMQGVAFIPIAANTVAFAAILKAQPQKAALGVLLTTLASLVLIPVSVMMFGT